MAYLTKDHLSVPVLQLLGFFHQALTRSGLNMLSVFVPIEGHRARLSYLRFAFSRLFLVPT